MYHVCIYIRHFPSLLKEHKSHDVLLMCVTCHQRSNHHDNELKRHLLNDCRPNGAATSLDGLDKYVHDPVLTKVKSAAKYVTRSQFVQKTWKTSRTNSLNIRQSAGLLLWARPFPARAACSNAVRVCL